jgi:hypothetical protein
MSYVVLTDHLEEVDADAETLPDGTVTTLIWRVKGDTFTPQDDDRRDEWEAMGAIELVDGGDGGGGDAPLVITAVNPANAPPNDTLVITGTGLTGVDTVVFTSQVEEGVSVEASISPSTSDTGVGVIIPGELGAQEEGAYTVSVINSKGAKSNEFPWTLEAPPV